MPTRATVSCHDCALHETFGRLGDARSLIERHREETGHEAVWELGRLSSGVVRAGEEAGVCGRPECATDSPLSQVRDDAESR
jgi:hypothetical protein